MSCALDSPAPELWPRPLLQNIWSFQNAPKVEATSKTKETEINVGAPCIDMPIAYCCQHRSALLVLKDEHSEQLGAYIIIHHTVSASFTLPQQQLCPMAAALPRVARTI